ANHFGRYLLLRSGPAFANAGCVSRYRACRRPKHHWVRAGGRVVHRRLLGGLIMNNQPAVQVEKIVEMIGVSVGDMANAERVVLENVTWTVLAREYWAVGGLHASGKSNLLATVAGILPPMAGEYRLFGNKFGSPSDL